MPKTDEFPFSDLHSYKDFVVFVRLCAPSQFPLVEGVPADEQWSLELAFQGLREGLALAITEKGARSEFSECEKRIEDAYAHCRSGRESEGFFALEDVSRLLARVPSH